MALSKIVTRMTDTGGKIKNPDADTPGSEPDNGAPVADTPVADTPSVDSQYNGIEDYLTRIYEAQKAQAEQARQNALNQLQNSYNQGQSSVNQNADDALRQAYVNYRLGERNLGQQLSNQGLTGGATESVLANLYNNYGSNRANIERARNNNLADLAAQYNQGVADIGASTGADLTDLYVNYMNQLANNETNRQNYAAQLAKALGNSASKSAPITSTTDVNPWGRYKDSDIINTVANLGTQDEINSFLDMFPNATDADKRTIQYMAGKPVMSNNQSAPSVASSNPELMTYGVPTATMNNIANRMKQIYNTSDYDEATRQNNVINAMRQIAEQYGLTEDQAREILAYAGL